MIFHAEPKDLRLLHINNISLYNYSMRDLSLCLKIDQNKIGEILLNCANSEDILFLRSTMFSIACSIRLVNNFLDEQARANIAYDRLIVPDAYSAYIALADELAIAHGIKAMILTADYLFKDLLKITPISPHALNISKHNIQAIGYEYAEPNIMFRLAKDYVEQKMLCGLSSQAYSSSDSSPEVRAEVESYTKNYKHTIVYYSSSPDEQPIHFPDLHPYELQTGLISSGSAIFDNEFICIENLFYFCRKHNFGLIIRLHPRLGIEKRSRKESTSRATFLNLISHLNKDSHFCGKIILPECHLSSYWLGGIASLNVFYRSSIGMELMLLGFPVISPHHMNSLTYQGSYMESYINPATVEDWHQAILRALQKGFVYYLHLAVRAFYFDRCSSSFVIGTCVNSGDVSVNCKQHREDLSLESDSDIFGYIVACSSLRLPRRAGYWDASDYANSFVHYLRWLKNKAYRQIGLGLDYSSALGLQVNEFRRLLGMFD
jgi:hypothetical protein